MRAQRYDFDGASLELSGLPTSYISYSNDAYATMDGDNTDEV